MMKKKQTKLTKEDLTECEDCKKTLLQKMKEMSKDSNLTDYEETKHG